MNRIIISFTTIPSRIQYIGPVIESICKYQTQKPDIVKLYISEIFNRSGEKYNIPDNIKNYQNIYPFEIVNVREDKGPITKIVYAFEEYTDPNDIIICIDDDIVYHTNFIKELLEGNKEYPERILGFMGNNPPNRPYVHSEHIQYGYNLRKYEQVKNLGGYRGILFIRKFIENDFFKLIDELNKIHQEKIGKNILEDDTFISLYFKLKGIKLYVLGTFYPGNIYSNNLNEQLNFKFLDSSNIGALYNKENIYTMNISRNILEEYFSNKFSDHILQKKSR